jgi:hypothetical protein
MQSNTSEHGLSRNAKVSSQIGSLLDANVVEAQQQIEKSLQQAPKIWQAKKESGST